MPVDAVATVHVVSRTPMYRCDAAPIMAVACAEAASAGVNVAMASGNAAAETASDTLCDTVLAACAESAVLCTDSDSDAVQETISAAAELTSTRTPIAV